MISLVYLPEHEARKSPSEILEYIRARIAWCVEEEIRNPPHGITDLPAPLVKEVRRAGSFDRAFRCEIVGIRSGERYHAPGKDWTVPGRSRLLGDGREHLLQVSWLPMSRSCYGNEEI